MRLRKGVDRASTAWSSMDKNMPQYNFKIVDTKERERESINATLNGEGEKTGSDINALVFQIPNASIEANKLISKGDNNLGAPTLKPE